MKITHLFATLFIIICTTVAWFLLAATLAHRTSESTSSMRDEVTGVWGPPLRQMHPEAWFDSPNARGGKARILPSSSSVRACLNYDPKRRGLIWHRTYDVSFLGEYTFTNPAKIPQTLYITFPLPENANGLKHSEFTITGADSQSTNVPAANGTITKAILLPASASTTLRARYQTRGSDTWNYHFPDNRNLTGFKLHMTTNFPEINFPVGTGSPSSRTQSANDAVMTWDYPNDLAAPSIGMEMPKRLNAGPVASRIAFFAPVSLLLFVTLILLCAGLRNVPLHPMHVFFVATGFFAFHLLFAYLVDLLPLLASFAIASATSLLLVCGYLRKVGGPALLKISLPAQSVYLVLFSASFFIDGLTGITLTILSILTLAILMFLTAKTDWKLFFSKKPPALPVARA